MSRVPRWVSSRAKLSDCGRYRYWLERVWDEEAASVVFVMLNPSTADHEHDDPTIRRCMAFADQAGFGAIEVVNLFALRATDPNELRDAVDPVGPENDDYLSTVCSARSVCFAWGTPKRQLVRTRIASVLGLLNGDGEQAGRWWCLGACADGSPAHPLYRPSYVSFQPWPVVGEG